MAEVPTNRPGDLALVGAGYWGKNLARNFRALGALHTICDSNPAILQSYGTEYPGVARVTTFDEVLADGALTKVAIAAPAALHYRLAKAALRAGKDVFVEKPLCLLEEEGQELVDIARERGSILMVGHLLQYHPSVRKLQALVASGELGKLYYITSNRLNLGKIRREENALWSFAPHDLSVILSLADHQMPQSVRCVGEAYLNVGVPDTTLTLLRFKSALRAQVYVSWLNPFKEQKLTVVGSSAMAVFDDTRPWPEKLVVHRNYLTWAQGQVPTPRKGDGEFVGVSEQEPLHEECAHFLQCCVERTTPQTDGLEGLAVLRILQAAQRSLQGSGEQIVLPPTDVATAPCSQPYFAHPTAVVDEGAVVGDKTRIWHFSHVMKGARIGRNCILGQNVNVDGGSHIGDNVKIQNNVSIYSGVEIGDDVFLGPSCVLTNVTNPRSQVNRHQLYEKTVIQRGATIGANATILCGVTVGRYAFVGAGAVVTGDVADYSLVVGNPARHRGWMSRHGQRLQPEADGILRCPESGLRYAQTSLGVVRCLDLDEDLPLPAPLATGKVRYRELSQAPGGTSTPGRKPAAKRKTVSAGGMRHKFRQHRI